MTSEIEELEELAHTPDKLSSPKGGVKRTGTHWASRVPRGSTGRTDMKRADARLKKF